MAQHEGRGTLGLEAEHARRRLDEAGAAVLAEAAPVGGDVAGVADRDGQVVGRAAEVLADLEGGRLLALDAVGVDRVDERHRRSRVGRLGELADDAQRVVEVAVHGHHPGAGGLRLEQLAGGDAGPAAG